jgi:hypothetical protein
MARNCLSAALPNFSGELCGDGCKEDPVSAARLLGPSNKRNR